MTETARVPGMKEALGKFLLAFSLVKEERWDLGYKAVSNRRKYMHHYVSHTVFPTHIREHFHFLGGEPLLPSLTKAVNSELAPSSASPSEDSNSALTALGHLEATQGSFSSKDSFLTYPG